MIHMIKKPDGEMIQDRRRGNGSNSKLIFLLIMLLVSSATFSITKWVNPIQARVEILESDYKNYTKNATEKEVSIISRVTRVEEGIIGLNSRLERMDNKIDKLLERSFRPLESRPYTAQREGSV